MSYIDVFLTFWRHELVASFAIFSGLIGTVNVAVLLLREVRIDLEFGVTSHFRKYA